MDGFMKGILSRTLTEEIENQLKWKDDDVQRGLSGDERDDNIARIKQFMQDNDIPTYVKCY